MFKAIISFFEDYVNSIKTKLKLSNNRNRVFYEPKNDRNNK